jgi:DOPA 4,5-dioxygenase
MSVARGIGPVSIEGFHAHVYFRDADERTRALALRVDLSRRFRGLTLGRVHDRAIGPHPIPMYQVAFPRAGFAGVVPWLMCHRRGLSVLIHPLVGDPLPEHDDYASWLGRSLTLRLEVFSPR